jgi:signal transduction histidine kinase
METGRNGSGPSRVEGNGNATQKNARWLPRWLSFSDLQSKLIVPYVILTLLLATVGIYIITRLVTSSVTERFFNQLNDAAKVAERSITKWEKDNLGDLRSLVFIEGVPEAVEDGDIARLSDLLLPVVVNNKVQICSVIDLRGSEIITWGMDPVSSDYLVYQGSDFSAYPIVQKVIDEVVDNQGDKFTGLVDTPYGKALMISAPVRDISGRLTGVIMTGSYLKTIVATANEQAIADIVVLDQDLNLLATYLPKTDFDKTTIINAARQFTNDPASTAIDLNLSDDNYQISFRPFTIRNETLGWIGAILPSNFVVSTTALSRDLFSLTFTLGTIAVIAIGYLLARNIALPILKLRTMSQEVAAGNLDHSSGLSRSDEIGELANAFDQMTLKLRERTEEAARLYAETVQRNKELAEINAKLQAMQLQLIQSEKLAAVGQLTAGIVHDVKNPLTVIKGMAEILQEDDRLDPAIQNDLKVISESAIKANRIVTDLLKFARQSAPEMQSRDLRETIEAALRLTAYLIREARIQLTTDLPEETIMVRYDPQQIEQVVINMLHNAVQAMPDHGTLRVAMRGANGAVALAIQDTGIGIPPENLGRIFDPFFTTKPEGVGTGLGLSVSYGIISNHGGRIDVESEVGKGTTFTILLPVDQSAQISVEK